MRQRCGGTALLQVWRLETGKQKILCTGFSFVIQYFQQKSQDAEDGLGVITKGNDIPSILNDTLACKDFTRPEAEGIIKRKANGR